MTDVYAKLAEHLNYPNSSYLMKILQQLMTPEEGKLVADFALAGAKLGTNEEATKNAFVMPFIKSLGYDVFNPIEVVPEYTADIGTKKGEKVDYAIKREDKIIILIECKGCGCDLEQEDISQLYRYFSATDARFGILTNGIYYRFFSDIDEPNKMDSKPFFEFNILDFEEHQIEELKKFTKSAFDLDKILTTASELKYTNSLKRIFSKELSDPSQEFTKFFGSQVYTGKMTQRVMDQFANIVRRAFNQFIRERVNDRIKSALDVEQEETIEGEAEAETKEVEDKGIVTTEEEIEGFNIVKAIAREMVDVKRVYMRDTKSYCGIILDDNNRKPICRFHFDAPQKYIGLFTQKEENRMPIDDLDDLFKYAERIKATINEYLEPTSKEEQ